MIPSLAGGITVNYLPQHIVRTQGIGLFNMYIEFLIRRARSPFIVKMRNSKMFATVCFMILSSGIMAARQLLQLDRFWFASVDGANGHSHRENNTNGTRLLPSISCQRNLLYEVKQSFYVGLAASGIKILLPRLTTIPRSPLILMRLLITRFDYRLLSFLILYKAIYNGCNCTLDTWNYSLLRSTPIMRDAISGFLAGIAYRCFPNYLLFTFPITELVELSWMVYLRIKNFPKHSIFFWIDRKLPVAMLLYTVSLGLLCHLRVVYPYHTNHYWHRLMANGTWGRSETLARGYASVLLG
ncbi:uncharacterized protein LOC128277845 [Anopheles cruzii]|uniref:uncharacterized protein LOC128277845 n=1 Tax=Anopheles cruzii TaxID=68878 RepID=UPI0022EC5832|nr:uncharacterized protein LOC128277845 [Anopheles cruzii]